MRDSHKVLNQVIQFIREERGEYRFPISVSTSLQDDLKIYGDDAVDFIKSFEHRFKIDMSKFSMSEHFRGEGFSLFELDDFKPFTVGDLINLIIHRNEITG